MARKGGQKVNIIKARCIKFTKNKEGGCKSGIIIIKKKKTREKEAGDMPSGFSEFLPITKQGCWPPSKLLATLRNQFCILGLTEGKLPQEVPD